MNIFKGLPYLLGTYNLLYYIKEVKNQLIVLTTISGSSAYALSNQTVPLIVCLKCHLTAPITKIHVPFHS
jgi:hypothetical protein